MARISPADPAVYKPLFGAEASPIQKVLARSPQLAAPQNLLGEAIYSAGILPFRLTELVRIRVAFHNQCRNCMAARYVDSEGDVVGEDVVCSLERPQEADDLTEPEKVALRFADLFATNHLAIDDVVFGELRQHFTEDEIIELCLRIAWAVGFGRMTAILNFVEEDDNIPESMRTDGLVSPWGHKMSS
jgi:alkylhydroperoxidase family enzyme